jgi:hypothetical protein
VGRRSYLLGELYDLRLRIEEQVKAKGLDLMEVKGKIGLRSGKLFALITPTTVDDPESIAKLKKAALEVLNLAL